MSTDWHKIITKKTVLTNGGADGSFDIIPGLEFIAVKNVLQ